MTTDELVQQAIDKIDSLRGIVTDASTVSALADAVSAFAATLGTVDSKADGVAGQLTTLDGKADAMATTTAALGVRLDAIQAVLDDWQHQRGKLDSVLAQPYVCQCAQMAVVVQCATHDYRVTYPNFSALP